MYQTSRIGDLVKANTRTARAFLAKRKGRPKGAQTSPHKQHKKKRTDTEQYNLFLMRGK